MTTKSRPWSAYALRVLCSVLLFATSYVLLRESTFAIRLRNDMPVELLVVALAATLAFVPLLAGRRYLGALVVSAFIASGVGGYWWTSIPWDELIKDSAFTTEAAPRLLDYLLVASPVIIAAFYAAVSRPSLLRADLKNRGADAAEIRKAACVSFLSGAALLLLTGALSFGLWALMASGVVFAAVAPLPTGVPALILVSALVAVAYGLISRRVRPGRFRAPATPAPEPRAGVLTRLRSRWSAN